MCGGPECDPREPRRPGEHRSASGEAQPQRERDTTNLTNSTVHPCAVEYKWGTITQMSDQEQTLVASPELGLLQMVAAISATSPQSIAISAPGRRPLTYGGLGASCAALADQLSALGLSRTDVVATVFPNGPEGAVAFLAVIQLSACAPVNPDLGAHEACDLIERLGVRLVLTLAGWSAPALKAIRATGIAVVELEAQEFAEPTPGENAIIASTLISRRLPAPGDAALILTTSGTTSRPKVVPLTHANLAASAHNIATWLTLGPQDRCLNVMPLFHVHGLVAAVLATLVSGGEVVCTPGFDAAQFLPWLGAHQPTWFTAVPTMHQAIAERARHVPQEVGPTRLRFVRSASAALPPSVAQDMEARFGAPMIEAYGMTEGAHQIASNPLPPRLRRPGTVGLAAGPEIAVMDQAGHPVPANVTGEIVMRGPNVVRGYADPAANTEAFFGDWLRTGDQGILSVDGYLTITGRLKEIINRGGEKISPREIDELLLSHPAVQQAVTFAVPDRRLGEQVAAAVVLREDVTEHALRQFAAQHLSAFKVPRRILVLDALPKGPTGKLQRIGLAAQLGLRDLDDDDRHDATTASHVHTEPHTPAQQFLADLWADVLKLSRVGVHDRFLDVGGDSLAAVRLLARIHEALDIEVSMIDFFDRPTVSAQADLIERVLMDQR